jgi:hypothetical protein
MLPFLADATKQIVAEYLGGWVRALSLIGELIYGTKASWKDPVKYNFAHGGKDGVPYPVARKVYDKSIGYLSAAIEGAEIERDERIRSLKKLAEYSATIFAKRKYCCQHQRR